MKTNVKLFGLALTMAVAFVFIACNNPFFPAKKVKGGDYTVVIKMVGSVTGDSVVAAPVSGNAGDSITLNYTVANTKLNNFLDFGGVSVVIASVEEAGSGTRTYAIKPADASGGKIVITATFEHTDLALDPIAFTDTAANIAKTYGDAAFTNAITAARNGTGAITYASSNTGVATVNGSSGLVTMHSNGTTVITANKAEDAVYARATNRYTLTVAQKPVTITGLGAADKAYNNTTAATVTGTATISGLVGGDVVTVNYGTASFASAAVGDNKTVTFSGFSLGGADARKYTLSAQPASVTANIVLIPPVETVRINPNGATFTMGSPTGESGRSVNEIQHSVTLTQGFYMGKYQVTQEQYVAVMGSNPSRFSGSPAAGETQGKRPVEQVNWYDALVFCNKLSMLEGLSPAYRMPGYGNSTDPAVWGTVPTGNNATWNAVEVVSGSTGYRLPTEAQWEYACRAGTTTAYNLGSTWNDNWGWIGTNSNNMTHEVGKKTPNAYDLHDMHGNVYEWCWDWYDANYGSTAEAAVTDPTGASSGSSRVLRGGRWSDSAQYARSAYRSYNNPDNRGNAIGFRLLRPTQ